MNRALVSSFSGSATHELVVRFQQRFGQTPRLFRAPGRVNLIGEHTDYNQGWVMPVAIDFSTLIAIAPRRDRSVRVISVNFDQEFKFEIDEDARPAKNWTDYVRGVVTMLDRSAAQLPGADIMLFGDVPLGAGLSSSASLEVATAVAMLAISGITESKNNVAKLCQRAENEFVGARCGIMDQFISANGRAGNALMLDCRSLDFELVQLPQEVTIVVSNTMVKHQLSGGEYNTRRAECEQGVRLFRQWFPAVESLRDVSPEMLEQHRRALPEVVYRRCRHVIAENRCVLEFAKALRAEDLSRAGALMGESHRSLREDYEVSCPELDAMVDAAQQPGLIGSRMTGGGFGGCTVSLVHDDAVDQFRMRVAEAYRQRTGISPEIYVTQAADGASELPIQH